MTWQQRAEALWKIIDDIDTLGDSTSRPGAGGAEAFRTKTIKLVAQRFPILASDGYKLSIPKGESASEAAIDWARFPHLRPMFEERPRENFFWHELMELSEVLVAREVRR